MAHKARGPMMHTEPASEADIEAIAALWHKGWHQGHGDFAPAALVATRVFSEFQERSRRHLPQTHVLRRDGQIAGFYMLEGDEVYQFYVAAAFQGQGVAAALMAQAEAALAGKLAWLACSEGNARAARFYEKAGWQRRGTQSYEAETAAGPQIVTIWRYEKDLR
jgi:GNAT superfamily N-acetyltransferase